MAATPQSLAANKAFAKKLNETLVLIVKREWPARWPTFMQDLVESCKRSSSECENNVRILKLLSEEVFENYAGNMTSARAQTLQETFAKELGSVFSMFLDILTTPQELELLRATLETLSSFLTWLPAAYITMDTKLITVLGTRYLAEPVFRNVVIRCLVEIAAIDGLGEAQEASLRAAMRTLLACVVQTLQAFFPVNSDLSQLFRRAQYENDQNFVRDLALFFSTFFRHHIARVECAEMAPACKLSHQYLLLLSRVDDDTTFRACMEYWKFFTEHLYCSLPRAPQRRVIQPPQAQEPPPLMLGGPSASAPATATTTASFFGGGAAAGAAGAATATAEATNPEAEARKKFYAEELAELRRIVVTRFAKPDEVLLTEVNGVVEREVVKNTEVTALYKVMREVLVYLTHLDYTNTQQTILEVLNRQKDGQHWSRSELCSMSWAVGSISGAMPEEVEGKYVVIVVRDLLLMVGNVKSKDDKAAIAGNIMYVVGQYPRFLRGHWRFMKTVLNKLFEFMHEQHEGVRDMAVDTFLKIAIKCKRKFITLNAGDKEPFVDTILDNLIAHTCDLEWQQQRVFYTAMAHIVTAQTDVPQRDALLARLMGPPNVGWDSLVQQLRSTGGLEAVLASGTKQMVSVLRVNAAVAETLGSSYTPQMGRIYVDLINVYQSFSQALAKLLCDNPASVRSDYARNIRHIKQDILHLIEVYIAHSQQQDARLLAENFVTPLLTVVLPDYHQSPPDARDAQVLSLMTCVIERLQSTMTAQMPAVFMHLFKPTLDMITTNFTDYPDHRTNFFAMVQTINTYCFEAFFSLSAQEFKMVLDCTFWAIRHTERTVSETGLRILEEMLRQISQRPEVADPFYTMYYTAILREIFAVLTDTFHKAEFKLHAAILRHLFDIVLTGRVRVPLWDSSFAAQAPPGFTNATWLAQYINMLFASSFPSFTPAQIAVFVNRFLEPNQPLPTFKQHLRDFLVSIKEFSNGGQDNNNLYTEEAEAARAQQQAQLDEQRKLVPGLLKPSELPDDA